MIPNLLHFVHLNPADGRRDFTFLFGRPLVHPAHKADIIRLRALEELGRLYLDLDTITVKSLEPLRDLQCALGQQLAPAAAYGVVRQMKCFYWRNWSLDVLRHRIDGLCNGVILARPRAEFLRLWLESYRSFRSTGHDEYWGEHSTFISYALAKAHRSLVTQLSPFAFHFPLYDPLGLELLFVKSRSFPRAYVHHLWESQSVSFLQGLTPRRVQQSDSTYNRIARHYL